MFVLSNTFFHSQYLVSCVYLGISSSNVLSGATGLSLDYDVKMYKLTYNTVDTDSLPIIATGAFFIPTNTTCTDFPFAVYNHGTTLRKNDVPSNNNPEAIIGKVFSAGGYFVCMPEYFLLTLVSYPSFHEYLHKLSYSLPCAQMQSSTVIHIHYSIQIALH